MYNNFKRYLFYTLRTKGPSGIKSYLHDTARPLQRALFSIQRQQHSSSLFPKGRHENRDRLVLLTKQATKIIEEHTLATFNLTYTCANGLYSETFEREKRLIYWFDALDLSTFTLSSLRKLEYSRFDKWLNKVILIRSKWLVKILSKWPVSENIIS